MFVIKQQWVFIKVLHYFDLTFGLIFKFPQLNLQTLLTFFELLFTINQLFELTIIITTTLIFIILLKVLTKFVAKEIKVNLNFFKNLIPPTKF